jgi:hypothetical protein
MSQRIFRTFLFALLGLTHANLSAQEVQVDAAFLQDSVRLGDQVDYYLTARYPSQLTVLFPDSTYNFGVFEFHRKMYFPTRTSQGTSYDSVVYRFFTFDIEDIQRLALPVFVVNAQDCTRYEAPMDSLVLKSLMDGPVPDSLSAQDLPLKTNTFYQQVAFLFNYPVLAIVVGSLVVLLVIVWIVFGKRIRKYFRVKQLQKNHIKFQDSYTMILQQLQNQFAANLAESALSLWKKYLEQLEQKPYTKLTTRETLQFDHDENLGKSLQMVDKAIYGNSTAVVHPLEHLKRVAQEKYAKKLEEVRHG